MSFLPDVVKHRSCIKRSIITMFTLHTLFFIMHLSEKKNDDNILPSIALQKTVELRSVV